MSIGEQRLRDSADSSDSNERTPLLKESADTQKTQMQLFTEMEWSLQVALLKVGEGLVRAALRRVYQTERGKCDVAAIASRQCPSRTTLERPLSRRGLCTHSAEMSTYAGHTAFDAYHHSPARLF